MKRKYAALIISTILLLLSQSLTAQIDSLRFKSGEFMIGEIKSLDKGIIKIDTDYSASDFEIEWDQVIGINTTTKFMITLSNGKKFYGKMKSVSETTLQVSTTDQAELVFDNINIVALNPFDDNFLDRLSASISFGFDLAKAKNLRSFTTRSAVGYHAEKWSTDLSFYTLSSKQDSVEDIRRTEAELNFRYVLPRRFYAIATISGLSNTEQKLDLRMNAQLGVGNYLVQTNAMYWGAKLGFNRNFEKYTNEEDERQSWEAYLGTEVNLFNMGDLDIYFLIMAYPGLTETGRWRTDSKLDIKYQLPLDFFINLGISFNYDNQPSEGASEMDYVFHTGFGWEW